MVRYNGQTIVVVTEDADLVRQAYKEEAARAAAILFVSLESIFI